MAAIALIYLHAGKFESAIAQAQQTLALAREVGGLYSEGIAEQVWGEALTALGSGNYPEAETHLAASAAAFEKSGGIIFLAKSLIAWGDLYLKQDKLEKALENYQKAKSLFEIANLTTELELLNQRISQAVV